MTKKYENQFCAWLPSVLSSYGVPDPLREVILGLARCSKVVSRSFDLGPGHAGTRNSSGEDQMAVDVLADRLIADAMSATGLVEYVASEEMEEPLHLSPGNPCCNVVYDPVDGSSVMGANFTVGTIFGILPPGELMGKRGSEMLAAGYFLYGPRTLFVLALPEGVICLSLNSLGEYQVEEENISLQEGRRYFAPGNLRAVTEREDYASLLNSWERSGMTLRYSGSMVADAHHILHKRGGVFLYPGGGGYPNGKLRLLFEVMPLSYVIEKAGGMALTEQGERILDQPLRSVHERSTVVMGSGKLVREAMGTFA